MTTTITSLLISALFVTLGVLLRKGKCAWFIAGYNTMSKEEKAKYNEKELCRGMGNSMFVFAFCCIVITASEVFEIGWLANVGGGLIILTAIVIVIWGNLSKKVKSGK